MWYPTLCKLNLEVSQVLISILWDYKKNFAQAWWYLIHSTIYVQYLEVQRFSFKTL